MYQLTTPGDEDQSFFRLLCNLSLRLTTPIIRNTRGVVYTAGQGIYRRAWPFDQANLAYSFMGRMGRVISGNTEGCQCRIPGQIRPCPAFVDR